jgi:5-methylcytosine-specific restriction endonuclease McrA
MSLSIANRRVLVLNQGWQPVGVINLAEAITKLFGEYTKTDLRPAEPKALIVDPNSFETLTWEDWADIKPKDGEEFISSINESFRIPEVITLTRYNKMPKHRVTFSRRAIYKRDDYTCQYCGCCPGSQELTIDHVLPRSKGGETTWLNCVLACLDCNGKKADKNLAEFGKKLLREPFKPKYQMFKGDITCGSWKKFISEAYWNVEMVNDEPEV